MKQLKAEHVSISPAAVLVAALIASGSVLSQGAVLNGDFSSTLNNWTTTGDVSVQGPSFNGGSTPPAGTPNVAVSTTIITPDAAPLSGNNAVSGTALESFLGLAAGTLSGGVVEGSGMKQTLTGLAAGDTLNFKWNFYTGEDAAGLGTDYAFYTLHQGSSGTTYTVLADPNSGLLHAASGGATFARETGFQTGSTITIPSGGDWVLGFGVADAGGNPGVDSALGVASVSYTAVPEPWAWSVISALALGGLAVARRVRIARA